MGKTNVGLMLFSWLLSFTQQHKPCVQNAAQLLMAASFSFTGIWSDTKELRIQPQGNMRPKNATASCPTRSARFTQSPPTGSGQRSEVKAVNVVIRGPRRSVLIHHAAEETFRSGRRRMFSSGGT